MAKVKALERQYPDLLHAQAPAGVSWPTDAVAPLDIATVVKAAHAITSELVLEDFLRELVRIALENAGAQRGVFLQAQDGQLVIAAAGSVDAGAVTLVRSQPVTSGAPLPLAVLSYVRQTGESVVVGDARTDERFASDPYIIATQATISLENAKLYEAVKAEMVERRRAEEQLRRAMAEVETLKNRLQVENVYLQEEIRQEHNFEEMVGSSPALLAMLQTVETVAPTDATVLLYGETGTGKELIARALHNRSARKDRPLVKWMCALSPRPTAT
jgi:transcriptional regulator of acetoin/glycerol metabolism